MQIKNEGFIELKHWTKRRRNRQRHRKTHYKLNDISTTNHLKDQNNNKRKQFQLKRELANIKIQIISQNSIV